MNVRGYQNDKIDPTKKRHGITQQQARRDRTTAITRKPTRNYELPRTPTVVKPKCPSTQNSSSRLVCSKKPVTTMQHRYTVKPIIPARKKELISVAKAMHREDFAPRVRTLFQRETDAAVTALEQGIYIGWRCPEFTWDCIRLDNKSRCFCDHDLENHEPYKVGKSKLKCFQCPCKSFSFIPQRPEDIGEWWLRRRPAFNEVSWRAKCRCKHSHVEHNPETRKCRYRGCGCFRFESNFLCAACDRHLEDHSAFFENADTRKKQGLPYGQDYLPFNELPDLRNICLSGSADNSERYEAITSGPYAIPPPRSNTNIGRLTNNSTYHRR